MSGFGANPHPHDQAFQGGIFTDHPGRFGFQQGPLESYSDGSLGAAPQPGARLGLPPIPSIWPTTKPNPPVREVSGMLGALPEPLATIFKFMPYVGGAVGVYHGYQRNKGSVPWAIGWGAFGMWLWFLALPLAFVQGVGQPAGK